MHSEKEKKIILEVSIDGVSADLSPEELHKLRDLFKHDIKSVLDAKNPALGTTVSSVQVQKKTPS